MIEWRIILHYLNGKGASLSLEHCCLDLRVLTVPKDPWQWSLGINAAPSPNDRRKALPLARGESLSTLSLPTPDILRYREELLFSTQKLQFSPKPLHVCAPVAGCGLLWAQALQGLTGLGLCYGERSSRVSGTTFQGAWTVFGFLGRGISLVMLLFSREFLFGGHLQQLPSPHDFSAWGGWLLFQVWSEF